MGSLSKLLISLIFITASLVAQTSFKPKLVHLSYDAKPKSIYKNQIFSVRVNALIAVKKFEDINTSFSLGQNIKLLNPNNSWSIKDNNHIYNTFYFKALSKEIVLPNISITLKTRSSKFEKDTLEGFKLKTTPLYTNSEDFSEILAEKLTIKRFKVNRYDDKFNIIVLDIESSFGNLKDFHLNNVKKQGIESIQYLMPVTKAFYFAVVPNSLKVFEFSYFNLKEKKLNKLSFKVQVDGDQVSTQSDLNPIENDFDFYKISASAIISLVTLILFFLRRRFIYIILTTLGVGYIIYMIMPEENIYLKTNTNIYLLPTKNSTIFSVSRAPISVKKLKEKNSYIKILLPNDKIGWIRREDVKD